MGKDLSSIFERRPSQWDSRGNPYFWDELKELCRGKSLEFEDYDVAHLVCEHFKEVTGQPLTFDACVYVERLAHGGMSSGMVSGFFWLSKGIPVLIENLHRIKAGYPIVTLCGSTRFKDAFIETQKRLTLEGKIVSVSDSSAIPATTRSGRKALRKCWMTCISGRLIWPTRSL